MGEISSGGRLLASKQPELSELAFTAVSQSLVLVEPFFPRNQDEIEMPP